MPLTLATANALLKEDYQPAIREEVNQKVKFLMQVEKNTEDVVGLEAYLALHTGRNSGVGSRAEYGTLPTAGNQRSASQRVPMYEHFGRLALSNKVIKSMATDRGSFERSLRLETTGLVKDLKRNVNRQCFGTSDGVIALVAANVAVTTIALAATTTLTQFRQLEQGLLVDIGPISTNPQGSVTALEILSTAGVAGAYTMQLTTPGGSAPAAVTTNNNDAISIDGSGGNASSTGQKEITGLQTAISNVGTVWGVNPATVGVWKSIVDDPNPGTLRAISEQLVAKNMQATEIASGEEVTQLWSDDGTHRAYANLLTSLKRFQNTVEMQGGYGGLEVTAGGGSVPLAWERDCPSSTMFGLNTTRLIEFYESDWEWMDNDGAVLSRVPNVAAYEATMYKIMELATDARNCHFVIKDITPG